MLSREEKQHILNILENGEMTIEGQFTWGSNYTLLCTLELGEDSIPAVYKWCREGKLATYKLEKCVRISADDLREFLRQRRTGGVQDV